MLTSCDFAFASVEFERKVFTLKNEELIKNFRICNPENQPFSSMKQISMIIDFILVKICT